MHRPFFDSNPGSDPIYEALRAPEHPNSVRAREYFDTLWRDAAPFVGADLPESARAQFQPVFWEVYLAAALLQHGVPLVPRTDRGSQTAGPDLLQREPPVFYEAIAVTPGNTADAVAEPVLGVAQEVPDNAISLRLASGLSEKVRKYVSYRDAGFVPADVPYVIAINSGAVPGSRLESSLPRIVRTVLPFGHEVLQFDASTWQCVGRSYEHRAALTKRSGASVPTCFFDQPNAGGISAVLHSAVDPFNWPTVAGDDFVLVHNPQPAHPLARGHRPGAWEFWIEEGRFRGEKSRRAG